MARTSKGPRYFRSKKGWFATFNGERIRLTTGGKKETEEEAKEKYEAEQQARKAEVAGDRNTVWAVMNAYLRDCENRLKLDPPTMSLNTFKIHSHRIQSFNEHCGTIAVRDLRPQHVTDWIAAMQQERWSEYHKRHMKWGPGTAKQGRDAVKSAFIWAHEEAGLISRNPFERRGKGRKLKRRRRPSDRKVAITEAEHELLLGQANKRSKKGFYDLLLFLYHTGARPAEMYLARASEWDEARKAFVVKAAPESRGRYKLWHLGEDRVIYIPTDLIPLARRLMLQYPDGPIFRTGSDKPWKLSTICARFSCTIDAINKAARAKGLPAPVRERVTAYSYRHAFVTRWVEQGRHLWKLCELLNTSESMVRQHYSHLFERTETLRDSLDDFDRGTGAPPTSRTVAADDEALAS